MVAINTHITPIPSEIHIFLHTEAIKRDNRIAGSMSRRKNPKFLSISIYKSVDCKNQCTEQPKIETASITKSRMLTVINTAVLPKNMVLSFVGSVHIL